MPKVGVNAEISDVPEASAVPVSKLVRVVVILTDTVAPGVILVTVTGNRFPTAVPSETVPDPEVTEADQSDCDA